MGINCFLGEGEGTGINFKENFSTPSEMTAYFSVMAANYTNSCILLLILYSMV